MSGTTDCTRLPLEVQRAYVLAALREDMIVNERDGSPMVLVPAGELEMGDGEGRTCPKHRVFLDAYYIGISCVTNCQYKIFVDATGNRPPDESDRSGDPVWQGKMYPEAYADHPVVCVSWEDAKAYASWAGCRLPSEAQWEKAARGTEGYRYPWGNEWDESKCRNDKNRGIKTTCAVWGYPEGVSGYGTYNQGGNVWEWCSDWYDGNYYNTSPQDNPEGPEAGSVRVFRGGNWRFDGPSLFRCAIRNGDDPGKRLDFRGFRLVRAV